jgi:hypothetical protein
MKILNLGTIYGCIFFLQGCATMSGEHPINLKNSSSVMLRGVETSSYEYDTPPSTLVILFAGGNGRLDLAENSTSIRSYLKGNFLVASRQLFLTGDTVVFTIDCVTEHSNCPSDYRGGPLRSRDTLLLIDEIKARHPSIKNTWLVGMSRGAIDAGAVAYYAPNQIYGVIYAAGVLWDLIEKHGVDVSKITSKQYIIHHADDRCSASPVYFAQEVSDENGIPLILVNNGRGTGSNCGGGSPHSFYQQEFMVVGAINKIIQTGVIEKRFLP